MIGKSTVETENIGNRRDFRNSYFASFRQMLRVFGLLKLRAGLRPAVAIISPQLIFS
jgi:hypothetical protein